MNNNESNTLILGRIGGNSSISKTYLESMFEIIDDDLLKRIFINQSQKEKIYFDGERILTKYKEVTPDMREIDIINICPFNKYDSYFKCTISYFIIEFIEKSVLLRHLMDERMLLEENRKNIESSDELKLQ